MTRLLLLLTLLLAGCEEAAADPASFRCEDCRGYIHPCAKDIEPGAEPTPENLRCNAKWMRWGAECLRTCQLDPGQKREEKEAASLACFAPCFEIAADCMSANESEATCRARVGGCHSGCPD